MPWVRLSDDYAWLQKVQRAGQTGSAFLTASLCFNNSELTDGFIPVAVVPHLQPRRQGWAQLLWPLDRVRRWWGSRQLVKAGAWHPIVRDGVRGYLIDKEFLQHQPTKAQVLAKRARARRRWHELKGLPFDDTAAPDMGCDDASSTNDICRQTDPPTRQTDTSDTSLRGRQTDATGPYAADDFSLPRYPGTRVPPVYPEEERTAPTASPPERHPAVETVENGKPPPRWQPRGQSDFHSAAAIARDVLGTPPADASDFASKLEEIKTRCAKAGLEDYGRVVDRAVASERWKLEHSVGRRRRRAGGKGGPSP